MSATDVPKIFKPRADPHCRHCGFSLKGLADHGQCPECGTDYDPSNTHTLYEVPSTYACISHLGRPVLYSALVLPLLALAILPIAAIFAIPIGICWFGWRLLVFHEFMREHVLPPGMDVRAGTRPLGLAAVLVARTALAVGALLMICSIVLFAMCLKPVY